MGTFDFAVLHDSPSRCVYWKADGGTRRRFDGTGAPMPGLALMIRREPFPGNSSATCPPEPARGAYHFHAEDGRLRTDTVPGSGSGKNPAPKTGWGVDLLRMGSARANLMRQYFRFLFPSNFLNFVCGGKACARRLELVGKTDSQRFRFWQNKRECRANLRIFFKSGRAGIEGTRS